MMSQNGNWVGLICHTHRYYGTAASDCQNVGLRHCLWLVSHFIAIY